MEKKTIGAFIAALRKANGLTQQELADRLGVSNKAVSRWERDECVPDLLLIPAIAEIFGVTCDELLKGERIFSVPEQEKSEPKVEKQMKALVNRSISRFKTSISISVSLSVMGYLCMLGISYGFYRPTLAFFVMALFLVGAGLVATIATTKMRENKRSSLLLEDFNPRLLTEYDRALGEGAFAAFFIMLDAVICALPLLLFQLKIYVAVLAVRSYAICLLLFASVLILFLFSGKYRFVAWVTEHPYTPISVEKSPVVRRMNRLQVGSLLLANLIYLIYPFFQQPQQWINNAVYSVPLVCFAVNILSLVVPLITQKGARRKLLLPGIRNIFLIVPTIFVWNVNQSECIFQQGSKIRFDMAYVCYALISAMWIFLLFWSLKEIIRNTKREKLI